MNKEKKQNYVDETIKEYSFIYDGPVKCFGKIICNRFSVRTIATTEKKAISNIKDQYKRYHGLTRKYQIELDDNCIKCTGEV